MLDRVRESNSDFSNIRYIEDFLIGVYQSKHPSPINLAVDKIVAHNGFIKINDLAHYACLSVSQLRKRFNEEVGMSPKEYSKVIRVHSIVQHLSYFPERTLTELTYQFKYFDQSHFIREFKAVMGISPKQYMKTY